MKLLFLGDIFGKPGRDAIKNNLAQLVSKQEIDVVIANGENAAGGLGITPRISDNLLGMGIDVLTSGNHIYKKKEIYEYLEQQPRLLKPANYPPSTPGRGFHIFSNQNTGQKNIAVVNICGRVFVENLDCPFRRIEDILRKIKKETNVIIVDFHGEVTSEKVAMGWFLDGRVSAVIGTHTHVQTADERILPNGTAYITDAGMVGPRDSVIGVKKEIIIERFIKAMPHKFEVSNSDVWINGVVLDIDMATGHANSIERINMAAD
ncbi:MAG: TIGR00282 family metallophosphoesterase [Actinomycetia bacterium]|nr:TIGR00282 family metallophosphoesterase [Actinomycetes bacterium]